MNISARTYRNVFVLFTSLALSAASVTVSSAATLSIGGNYRFGANLYSNLDLSAGTPTGSGNTNTFLEHRILLKPDVIIDDRFTIKTEWNLAQLVSGLPNIVPPDFGSSLDGEARTANGKAVVDLRRAWLEWASDWGIFRFGRQPKNWGLGLLYDAGHDPLDDFGTTADRAGFQALLGNLGVNVGYEKASERLLSGDIDDTDTYELSLDYSNPESQFDVGLLYARNVRSAGVQGPMLSSHDLSIFATKKWAKLQLGGELASIKQDERAGQTGILVQTGYNSGALSLGVDLAYATADSTGSFSFNPNYQPFMILFRQSLGSSSDKSIVRNGDGLSSFGATSGGALAKASFSYGFDNQRYVLGLDLGYASLVRNSSGGSKALGVETDIRFSQKWYENFKMFYGLGLLFPGDSFGPNSQTAWGLQVRGALTF